MAATSSTQSLLQSLPQPLLTEIYSNLPLHDKLAASGTCKACREALFTPRCLLLEDLKVRLSCGSGQQWHDRGNVLKVIRQVKNVTLEWSPCRQEDLLCLVDSLQLPHNQMQNITLNPRGNRLCKKDCKLPATGAGEDGSASSFQATIVNFVLKSRNLVSVSLGYDLNLCRSLIETAVSQSGSQECIEKLKSLNIACVTAVQTPSSLSAIPSLGKNLVQLGVTWDYNFPSILDLVLDKSLAVKQLDLVAETSLDVQRAEVPYKTWMMVNKNVPELKVSVTIVETQEAGMGGGISGILAAPIPLVKFVLIYQNPMFALSLTDLVLLQYARSLVSIGVHCIEDRTVTSNDQDFFIEYFLDRLLDPDAEIPVAKVREISLSGCYLSDDALLHLLTQDHILGHLDQFRISQHDVVSESMSTDYLIQLTQAQVYGLEKAVSVKWRNEWKMLTEVPVQRKVRGHGRIAETAQCILQDNDRYC